MNPLIRPWRHLFDFSGRASRSEYGLFHITAIGVFVLTEIVVGLCGALFGGPGTESAAHLADLVIVVVLGIFSFVGFFAALIGHLSVTIRRLHDQGEPGIKFLLTFIPFVGFIFWLMLVFTPGNDYENDYGPDPRLPEQESVEALGSVFS